MDKMKVAICTKYGAPEVLQLSQIEKPTPNDHEVLVKIHTTAVTASDCVIRSFKLPGNPNFPKKQLMEVMMRLFIGFSKPRNPILGLVFSGEIESLGKNIQTFTKGDLVYGFTGNSRGAYANYKCVSAKEIAQGELTLKPINMNHEEAVAILYGGVLALHFMKKGAIKNRDKVLIYGASGAIGTMAIQFAKSAGAEVTAVCSAVNFELVKSLGADKLIDYTKENAIDELITYDFILDAVGKNKGSILKTHCKKALNKYGKYISVDDGLLKVQSDYLLQLKRLAETKQIKGVIDKIYPLEQIIEAHSYVDQGHKKGNVIITL